MLTVAIVHRELKSLIQLATPLLVAQSLTTGTGVVDAMMSGQYSASALAAVAVGNSLWLPLYLLISGMLIATTTMVARYHGANQPHNIVTAVQQSIWLALLLSIVTVLLLRNSEALLELAGVAPDILPMADGYLTAFSWGMPAVAIFNGLRGFTEGMGRTRPYMLSSLIAFLVNIPMNYALIYGAWGFPELGAVGCGWATAISFWVQVVMLAAFSQSTTRFEGIRLFAGWQAPVFSEITRIARLGTPIAMAAFAEVTIFSLIALLVARLGTEVIAGHQIALSASHVIFMLPLALSQAVTIKVGFHLGQNNQARANQIVAVGLLAALILSMSTMSSILLFRETIISWYTRDATVELIALSLFFWMALYQLPDHLQIISNASLRAYHDTRFPMLLILIAYWGISLPLGYCLGLSDVITAQPLAAEGFWIGLSIGLSIACGLLLTRLWIITQRPLS
jgi:MATE family multidrug resistance protein